MFIYFSFMLCSISRLVLVFISLSLHHFYHVHNSLLFSSAIVFKNPTSKTVLVINRFHFLIQFVHQLKSSHCKHNRWPPWLRFISGHRNRTGPNHNSTVSPWHHFRIKPGGGLGLGWALLHVLLQLNNFEETCLEWDHLFHSGLNWGNHARRGGHD